MYRSPLLAMRSKAGVGMTPPNVLGAPKPQSSVMMSRTLGAPLGGTTRGGHHGLDSVAFSLITPPNFGSGGGSCFPLMVVVALGEPGSPVTTGAGYCVAGVALVAAGTRRPRRSNWAATVDAKLNNKAIASAAANGLRRERNHPNTCKDFMGSSGG